MLVFRDVSMIAGLVLLLLVTLAVLRATQRS